MNDFLGQHSSQNYLQMFADDMQFMAYHAWRWGDVETGGGLYGLWSHAGRPVIMLATPQGPGACNETAHFAQDPKHLFKTSRKLQERFGLQYIGNWHSHHSLGLHHPSGGDVEQIHRVAQKSNVSKMIQIVFTRSRSQASSAISPFLYGCSCFAACQNIQQYGLIKTLEKTPGSINTVDVRMRMNTFIYNDAKSGFYETCPVNVLDESNPIRAALAGSELVDSSGAQFPLENILYERAGITTGIKNQDRLEKFVQTQLSTLADSISERAEVFIDSDMLFLSIPSTDNRIVTAYKCEPHGYRLCSVCIVGSDQKSVDITDVISKKKGVLSACDIYKRAKKWINSDKRKSLIDKCKDDENVDPKNKSKKALKKCPENSRSIPPCGQEYNNIA